MYGQQNRPSESGINGFQKEWYSGRQRSQNKVVAAVHKKILIWCVQVWLSDTTTRSVSQIIDQHNIFFYHGSRCK